jgi:hypothetical protein
LSNRRGGGVNRSHSTRRCRAFLVVSALPGCLADYTRAADS